MKDIKHIRRDFHSVTLVMPQGWDLGVPWGVGGQFFPPEIQPDLEFELHEWHMQRHNFLGPCPLGPWGGAKRSNIIKSQLQRQFHRFLNQTLCVFSQNERYNTYQTGFSFSPLVHAPGFGTWGCWGSKFNFLNMAMQGSNFSSHTRKMRVKKAISKVVFSLLAFSREWKFGAVIRGS